MKPARQKLLLDLLALPTAPFAEQYVAAYVRDWAKRHPRVERTEDRYGNILLRLRRGRPEPRPLVFVAHMDHPGFEADRMIRPGRLRAHWRGGVAPEYFPGARVRFHQGGRWTRGRVRSVETWLDRGRKRVKSAVIEVARSVEPGSIGMWDFPDPVIRCGRVYARGCDDIGGLAAILCMLQELHAAPGDVDVYGLCTRAEEVGFVGAIAAGREKLLPPGARVISVETSSELPGARMGRGPILRVGDLVCVFDPPLTAFCRRVAGALAKADKRFQFQRKLMDGGTCEASALRGFGFRATGICVALGNYHNMNRARRTLGPEYISAADFDALVTWFNALARTGVSDATGAPPLASATQEGTRSPRTGRKRSAALASDSVEEVEAELIPLLTELERQWMPLLHETASRARAASR